MAGNIRTVAWATMLGLTVFLAVLTNVNGVLFAMGEPVPFAPDFTVFWSAARADLAIVYDFEAITRAQDVLLGQDTGVRPFVNPPTALLILAPFALLPFGPAMVAWTIASVAALIVAVRKVIPLSHLALAAVSPPLFHALTTGQFTIFLTSLTIGGLSILSAYPVAAGIMFGIAATIKPQTVLLVPLALIAGRHWKALIAAMAAGLVIGATSIVLHGAQLWLDWINAAIRFAELGQRADLMRRSVTLSGLAFVLGTPAPAFFVVGGISGVLTVWHAFRLTENVLLRTSALIAGTLLCLSYAMPYDMSPLLIPAAALLMDRKESYLGWAVAALTLSGVMMSLSVLAMAGFALFRSLIRSDSLPLQPQTTHIRSLPAPSFRSLSK